MMAHQLCFTTGGAAIVTHTSHQPLLPARCSCPRWRQPPSTQGQGTVMCVPARTMRPLSPCCAASEVSNGPWTEQDLAKLSQQIAEDEEAALGEEWRSSFMDDPAELFFYAQQEATRWAMVQEELDRLPRSQWEASGLVTLANQFSAPLVNELMGMGTWRLKGCVDPAIAFLLQRLEGTWREAFVDDLCLYPRDKWKGKYDICDSMDPKRELEGWSYGDIPNPQPGQEGFPRLLLENRVYSSRVYRKLHVEIGWQQSGLQVLHAVLYPRYNYDLPILAMDLVVVKGAVTLAIIDACPVRADLSLPSYYLQTMTDLQELFLTDAANQRKIPDWGKNIFSEGCVCIRPEGSEDLAGFIAYAAALHRAHCMLSTMAQPLRAEPRNQAKLQELLAGHKRFVDNQLANKKTTRVLEAAFGPEWAEAYMSDMMFDFTPGDEPPLEDTSVVQLYQYFEQFPELGSAPEEMAALEAQVAVGRAEEVLDALANGEPVRQDNAEHALRVLYFLDPEFKSNCLEVMPQLAYMPGEEIGALLCQQLESLGMGAPVKRWTLAKAEQEGEEQGEGEDSAEHEGQEQGQGQQGQGHQREQPPAQGDQQKKEPPK